MKLRKKIIPVMASLVMTVSSYAEKDVTVLSFEDNSVMSSNTEGLKREIPKMLETRLSPDFDVIINPDSTVTSEGYNKESTAILKERLQGLDYIVTGSFSVINNQLLTISTRVTDADNYQVAEQRTEGNLNDLFGLVNSIADEIKTETNLRNVPSKPEQETVQNEPSGGIYTQVRKRDKTNEQKTTKIRKNADDKEGGLIISPLLEVSMPYGPKSFKLCVRSLPLIRLYA